MLLAAACVLALPGPAVADWYFTPFIGYDLNATTTFVDLQYFGGTRNKVTFGGSATLTRGVVGVEMDYAWVPGFFQRPSQEVLVTGSHVQTLTGNVLVLAPLSVTQESLRPYLTAGAGWMGAQIEFLRAPALRIDQSLVTFNAGVGAFGMFSERTGLRFDLRYFTNLDRDIPGSAIGSARVKFWRGSVGFVLHY